MLPIEYFEPFDRTYRLVTQRIRERTANFSPDEIRWMERLIVEFQYERDRWNEDKLKDYRKEWKRLRFALARLAAAAYLHVSYDLPRVIANEWPGGPKWPAPPLDRAAQIFFALDRDFLDVFSIAAKDPKIVGLPAYLFKPFSRRVLRSATHWVLLLRRACWQHAGQLFASGNRANVEGKMLFAVTAALKDVSDLPWTLGTLLPPDQAFAPAVLPVSLSDLDNFWVGAATATVFAIILEEFARNNWRRYNETYSFVEELGSRTYEYVSVAVRYPEEFDVYRARRTVAQSASIQ